MKDNRKGNMEEEPLLRYSDFEKQTKKDYSSEAFNEIEVSFMESILNMSIMAVASKLIKPARIVKVFERLLVSMKRAQTFMEDRQNEGGK